LEFVTAPEGEVGLTGYTVIVSSDTVKSGDEEDKADNLFTYKVKVVDENGRDETTKSKKDLLKKN
jgi:hypothetical protein